ncbi:carbon-nitrogen hydrolase family protein [Aureimonas altamirensis]|uniref:carbon-nitrogen hydrolase family protein n=1 Tax=Aureimonas altamirensis TaxID=370622 RepID=UPI001E3471A6|nr:carbon-nitrogen hydrolase family protein [Aureimonas altamirensis]UHD43786.1 carbon-nitrogen hydrolase family protein [Aureimonas altamirensis]
MTAVPLRMAALGIGPFTGDASTLLAEAKAGIVRLAGLGATLILLPELFAAPFYAASSPAEWAHLAEPVDGKTGLWAARLAAATGASIVYGMPVAGSDEFLPSNAVVLAAPGQRPQVVQRKVHLPPRGDDAFGEADHFAPGAPAITAFRHRGACICPLVCYDRRFPESWREAARLSADVVLVLVGGPANDPPGLFEAEIRTHARANAVYALAAARYGQEEIGGATRRHDGLTLAATPCGGLLPATGHAAMIEIDSAALSKARAQNPTHRQLRLY